MLNATNLGSILAMSSTAVTNAAAAGVAAAAATAAAAARGQSSSSSSGSRDCTNSLVTSSNHSQTSDDDCIGRPRTVIQAIDRRLKYVPLGLPYGRHASGKHKRAVDIVCSHEEKACPAEAKHASCHRANRRTRPPAAWQPHRSASAAGEVGSLRS